MHLVQSNEQEGYRLILKDGSSFTVDSEMIGFYQQAYPHLDIHEQMRLMVSWCFSNDAKRKTSRGIKRFINSWLNGAKPPARQAVQAQRDYAKQTTMAERLTDTSWAN